MMLLFEVGNDLVVTSGAGDKEEAATAWQILRTELSVIVYFILSRIATLLG